MLYEEKEKLDSSPGILVMHISHVLCDVHRICLSLFASLVYISARFLPVLIIYLSDKIYPSNHAFRYYFIGIVSSLIYAIVLFSAIRSKIPLGPNFWTYALFVYLIFSSIVMIVHGHVDAEERHRES